MAQNQRRTIFVGNIDDSTTSENLATAFQPFGAVVEVQIPPDPQNRSRHRNFAFVTFSTATSALDAVDNMHLSCLPSSADRKVLKVNLARPTGKTGAGGGGRVGGLAMGATEENDTGGWGSRKAVWESEEWLKEHEGNQAGAEAAEGETMQTEA